MKQKEHSIINHIDDLIWYALPSQVDKAFKDLCTTLQELVFGISSKKLVALVMAVVCLGVGINTITGTLSVPGEKLSTIKILCEHWAFKSVFAQKSNFNPY